MKKDKRLKGEKKTPQEKKDLNGNKLFTNNRKIYIYL